eukprot:Rmarinus@m.19316
MFRVCDTYEQKNGLENCTSDINKASYFPAYSGPELETSAYSFSRGLLSVSNESKFFPRSSNGGRDEVPVPATLSVKRVTWQDSLREHNPTPPLKRRRPRSSDAGVALGVQPTGAKDSTNCQIESSSTQSDRWLRNGIRKLSVLPRKSEESKKSRAQFQGSWSRKGTVCDAEEDEQKLAMVASACDTGDLLICESDYNSDDSIVEEDSLLDPVLMEEAGRRKGLQPQSDIPWPEFGGPHLYFLEESISWDPPTRRELKVSFAKVSGGDRMKVFLRMPSIASAPNAWKDVYFSCRSQNPERLQAFKTIRKAMETDFVTMKNSLRTKVRQFCAQIEFQRYIASLPDPEKALRSYFESRGHSLRDGQYRVFDGVFLPGGSAGGRSKHAIATGAHPSTLLEKERAEVVRREKMTAVSTQWEGTLYKTKLLEALLRKSRLKLFFMCLAHSVRAKSKVNAMLLRLIQRSNQLLLKMCFNSMYSHVSDEKTIRERADSMLERRRRLCRGAALDCLHTYASSRIADRVGKMAANDFRRARGLTICMHALRAWVAVRARRRCVKFLSAVWSAASLANKAMQAWKYTLRNTQRVQALLLRAADCEHAPEATESKSVLRGLLVEGLLDSRVRVRRALAPVRAAAARAHSQLVSIPPPAARMLWFYARRHPGRSKESILTRLGLDPSAKQGPKQGPREVPFRGVDADGSESDSDIAKAALIADSAGLAGLGARARARSVVVHEPGRKRGWARKRSVFSSDEGQSKSCKGAKHHIDEPRRPNRNLRSESEEGQLFEGRVPVDTYDSYSEDERYGQDRRSRPTKQSSQTDTGTPGLFDTDEPHASMHLRGKCSCQADCGVQDWVGDRTGGRAGDTSTCGLTRNDCEQTVGFPTLAVCRGTGSDHPGSFLPFLQRDAPFIIDLTRKRKFLKRCIAISRDCAAASGLSFKAVCSSVASAVPLKDEVALAGTIHSSRSVRSAWFCWRREFSLRVAATHASKLASKQLMWTGFSLWKHFSQQRTAYRESVAVDCKRISRRSVLRGALLKWRDCVVLSQIETEEFVANAKKVLTLPRSFLCWLRFMVLEREKVALAVRFHDARRPRKHFLLLQDSFVHWASIVSTEALLCRVFSRSLEMWEFMAAKPSLARTNRLAWEILTRWYDLSMDSKDTERRRRAKGAADAFRKRWLLLRSVLAWWYVIRVGRGVADLRFRYSHRLLRDMLRAWARFIAVRGEKFDNFVLEWRIRRPLQKIMSSFKKWVLLRHDERIQIGKRMLRDWRAYNHYRMYTWPAQARECILIKCTFRRWCTYRYLRCQKCLVTVQYRYKLLRKLLHEWKKAVVVTDFRMHCLLSRTFRAVSGHAQKRLCVRDTGFAVHRLHSRNLVAMALKVWRTRWLAIIAEREHDAEMAAAADRHFRRRLVEGPYPHPIAFDRLLRECSLAPRSGSCASTIDVKRAGVSVLRLFAYDLLMETFQQWRTFALSGESGADRMRRACFHYHRRTLTKFLRLWFTTVFPYSSWAKRFPFRPAVSSLSGWSPGIPVSQHSYGLKSSTPYQPHEPQSKPSFQLRETRLMPQSTIEQERRLFVENETQGRAYVINSIAPEHMSHEVANTLLQTAKEPDSRLFVRNRHNELQFQESVADRENRVFGKAMAVSQTARPRLHRNIRDYPLPPTGVSFFNDTEADAVMTRAGQSVAASIQELRKLRASCGLPRSS